MIYVSQRLTIQRTTDKMSPCHGEVTAVDARQNRPLFFCLASYCMGHPLKEPLIAFQAVLRAIPTLP